MNHLKYILKYKLYILYYHIMYILIINIIHNYFYSRLNTNQLDIIRYINYYTKWIYPNINHRNLILNIYYNSKHCKYINLNLIYILINIHHIRMNYIFNIQSHIKCISLHLGNNHFHIKIHNLIKNNNSQGYIFNIEIINLQLNNYHNSLNNNL